MDRCGGSSRLSGYEYWGDFDASSRFKATMHRVVDHGKERSWCYSLWNQIIMVTLESTKGKTKY